MNDPRDVLLAWVAAFNARDPDAAAALYHEDAVNHQVAAGPPVVGRAAIRADLRAFFAAFPDSVTRLENMLLDGDRVAIEWSGGGTWRGSFLGQSPNGRSFTLRGSGFFRVVDGKIATQRGYWDRATWFDALGLRPPNNAG